MRTWNVGDRVITDIGHVGSILRIRHDDRNDPIITVLLDDDKATPDGIYIAREFELRWETPR